jgi:hypothetical protein
MICSAKALLFCMLASITTGQDLASTPNLKIPASSLQTWGIEIDGRPAEGSAKQAVLWLGDWNNVDDTRANATTTNDVTSQLQLGQDELQIQANQLRELHKYGRYGFTLDTDDLPEDWIDWGFGRIRRR